MFEWDKIIPNLQEDCTGRNDYEKDYDRIIFSQCFRRLAGKTQVHPFPQNDHVHSRLSHSLEVSVVGQSIVKALVKDKVIPNEVAVHAEKIVMTAGLAHDIGNPPFGHIGEDTIATWVREKKKELRDCEIGDDYLDTYSSYDGNAQNFHIFKSKEYFDKKSLSSATIASLVKYPRISSSTNTKAGYFKHEENEFKRIFDELDLKCDGKYCRHPLSYLMEAADDICYSIMDVDDAYEMKISGDLSDVKNILGEIFPNEPIKDCFNFIRNKRGDLIEKAVTCAQKTFTREKDYILGGNVALKCDPAKKDLIEMGKDEPIFKLEPVDTTR